MVCAVLRGCVLYVDIAVDLPAGKVEGFVKGGRTCAGELGTHLDSASTARISAEVISETSPCPFVVAVDRGIMTEHALAVRGGTNVQFEEIGTHPNRLL